jgi:hypothetical protein
VDQARAGRIDRRRLLAVGHDQRRPRGAGQVQVLEVQVAVRLERRPRELRDEPAPERPPQDVHDIDGPEALRQVGRQREDRRRGALLETDDRLVEAGERAVDGALGLPLEPAPKRRMQTGQLGELAG